MFWSVAGGSLVGKKGIISLPDQDVKLQTMLSVAFGAVSCKITYVAVYCVMIWTTEVFAKAKRTQQIFIVATCDFLSLV